MNTLFSAGQRAGTTALSAARADAAAWGTAIESATCTVVAVSVACFVAGEALGRWVHQLNADLAAAYRCLLVGAHRAEAAAEQVVEQVVTWAGLPIECFSVVELRTLARQQLGSAARIEGRRIAQARRADLLLALGA
jgi:hypothetical protein